jgi:predicted nuclease of predicted toxin-antitoxin system
MDTGIMAYAQAHGFVVLTNDLDNLGFRFKVEQKVSA